MMLVRVDTHGLIYNITPPLTSHKNFISKMCPNHYINKLAMEIHVREYINNRKTLSFIKHAVTLLYISYQNK